MKGLRMLFVLAALSAVAQVVADEGGRLDSQVKI